jgi:hypothetical protein
MPKVKRNLSGKIVEFEDDSFTPPAKKVNGSKHPETPIDEMSINAAFEATKAASRREVIANFDQARKILVDEAAIHHKMKEDGYARAKTIYEIQLSDLNRRFREEETKIQRLYKENRQVTLDIYYDKMEPLSQRVDQLLIDQANALNEADAACEKVRHLQLSDLASQPKTDNSKLQAANQPSPDATQAASTAATATRPTP